MGEIERIGKERNLDRTSGSSAFQRLGFPKGRNAEPPPKTRPKELSMKYTNILRFPSNIIRSTNPTIPKQIILYLPISIPPPGKESISHKIITKMLQASPPSAVKLSHPNKKSEGYPQSYPCGIGCRLKKIVYRFHVLFLKATGRRRLPSLTNCV